MKKDNLEIYVLTLMIFAIIITWGSFVNWLIVAVFISYYIYFKLSKKIYGSKERLYQTDYTIK